MKKLSTRQLLILVLVIDIVLCAAFVLTNVLNKPKSAERTVSESNIKRICELATLECYYHNVSNWTQDPYGVLAFAGYGEKKIWIEYDGMVRVGINAGGIKVSDPDENNIITVTIPVAAVLDKDLDETTIREITSDKTVLGVFTDQVNTEDIRQALSGAQADMVESASKNEMVLGEARERAKKIIERNILAAGEANGKHYTVKFIDDSETPVTAPEEEKP